MLKRSHLVLQIIEITDKDFNLTTKNMLHMGSSSTWLRDFNASGSEENPKEYRNLANQTYTLMLVPDTHSDVKRYQVQKKWLIQGLVVLGLLAITAVGLVVHYASVVVEASSNPALREDNLKLKQELSVLKEQLKHIDSTLDRVERFDQKLRAMTLLSDPQRNLALGPVEPKDLSTPSNEFLRAKPTESAESLGQKLDQLSSAATRQEQSLQELQSYFLEQKSMLSSVPSVWPVRGWVTSDFGSRLDPYTSERVMHAGLDIAGEHGKQIVAPADGMVVFAGLEGGYGNVLVIDHGYGVKTRYGHLAAITVKPGEKVKRGDLVANLGNTGRSTGPHLHYEVRVNGIAQNPRKFILDEW
jgi:murein DD-endopeptidase MepM/ murein hydrolase activator NlpD